MELEEVYAEKAKMFREEIEKQANEEIQRKISMIRERKNAAGKAKKEREWNEALAAVRAERNSHEMKFKKESSRCEFETTKGVRAYRKKIIDSFFEEIRGSLEEFAKSAGYDEYLKKSLKKIESELGSEHIVFAAARDVEKVKALTNREVRVDNMILIGGISALNEKKGLFSDRTLDSALVNEREAFTDKPELRLN